MNIKYIYIIILHRILFYESKNLCLWNSEFDFGLSPSGLVTSLIKNLFCHIISMHNRLYGQVFFFKVYDTGFVFIFWLFEWKVCLMYNSQDSNIYIVIFQNYICPLSMLSHDQKFFDKAALCHLYDHIVSEFLLVCNIYEWQEMKCYIGE